jgi:hypothetical protein
MPFLYNRIGIGSGIKIRCAPKRSLATAPTPSPACNVANCGEDPTSPRLVDARALRLCLDVVRIRILALCCHQQWCDHVFTRYNNTHTHRLCELGCRLPTCYARDMHVVCTCYTTTPPLTRKKRHSFIQGEDRCARYNAKQERQKAKLNCGVHPKIGRGVIDFVRSIADLHSVGDGYCVW